LYTSTKNNLIDSLCQKYGIEQFNKKGGGIGKDWNNALSFVKTKYATIVHQDDIYLPTYGDEIIETFEKKKEINITFSDYEENDKEGNIRDRGVNLKIKTIGLNLMMLMPFKKYQRRIYAFGNFICCPAVSYNMERLSTFKFNEDMKMAVDWDAWERIMDLPGNISFIPKKLMYHRIHQESETTVNTISHIREKEEYEMYRRYWGKPIAKFLMKFYINNQKSNGK
jgi:hypothetical protein